MALPSQSGAAPACCHNGARLRCGKNLRTRAFCGEVRRGRVGGISVRLPLFRDSEGEPRNWISPRRHLQDWEAALAHVKGLPAIDASQIALWGTSFSGGHVIVVASRYREISAVVAQVPFADGLALLVSVPLKFMTRLGIAALRDFIQIVTRGAPFTVSVVGPPDSLAIMNMRGAWEGYQSLLPKGTSWKNACPARAVFTTSFYRPIRHAQCVRCPVLLVTGKRDEVIPQWSVKKEQARLPNAQLVALSSGHFDLYNGSSFEEAVATEQNFLLTHLHSN
jgi:pimeloyl-ACP methyl ester carboxylesterase